MTMKKLRLNFRPEKETDYPEVFNLHQAAFGQDDESRIVEGIRKSDHYIPALSLVAIHEDDIVGHILFSKIGIQTKDGIKESLALAPMAVLPKYQKKGIGSKLVEKGLIEAIKAGFKSVIVLGHPDYYPAFGFRKASEWNIRCPFEVPDEAFMAIELEENSLKNCEGEVVYPDAFMI